VSEAPAPRKFPEIRAESLPDTTFFFDVDGIPVASGPGVRSVSFDTDPPEAFSPTRLAIGGIEVAREVFMEMLRNLRKAAKPNASPSGS
jgi:hypothetical protein